MKIVKEAKIFIENGRDERERMRRLKEEGAQKVLIAVDRRRKYFTTTGRSTDAELLAGSGRLTGDAGAST